METSLEPHYTHKGLKRNWNLSKTDKARRTELGDAMEMAAGVVKDIMAEVGVRHDCGMSTACPAWYCCSHNSRAELEKRILELNILIDDLSLEDPELNNIEDTSEHIPNGQDNIPFSHLQLKKTTKTAEMPSKKIIKLYKCNLSKTLS